MARSLWSYGVMACLALSLLFTAAPLLQARGQEDNRVVASSWKLGRDDVVLSNVAGFVQHSLADGSGRAVVETGISRSVDAAGAEMISNPIRMPSVDGGVLIMNEQVAAPPADGPSACGATSLAISSSLAVCAGMALLGLAVA